MAGSLANYVTTTTSLQSSGARLAGFGMPLLVSYNAGWAERVRFYTTPDEVLVDFPSTTGPEYIWATKVFGQENSPERAAIGRGALPPTQKYTLVPTPRDTHTYRLVVGGDGATTTDVSVTSDADATATEVVTLLKTAINAIPGANFTATGTATLIVTGNAAGEWFFVQVVDTNDFTCIQDHADPGIATDLAAIKAESNAWYCLATAYNSEAYVKAAAAYIETQNKIYVFDTNETEAILDTSDGTQGLLDDLMTLGYARTSGYYHPAPQYMMAAAQMGGRLSLEPGAATWMYQQLAGVPAVNLTATHRANLEARNAGSYEEIADTGVSVVFNGKTFDGEWLDLRRDLDWVDDRISKAILNVKLGSGKNPFTDAGIAAEQGALEGVLLEAVQKGIFADDPAPTTTAPRASQVSAANKALRYLPGLRWAATAAGAIHKTQVIGTVSQ